MNNLNNQPPSVKKRRIASWILGTISILLSCLGTFVVLVNWSFFQSLFSERKLSPLMDIWFILTILYYPGVFVIAAFGLIKGIKELKLPPKKPAIMGVILCLVSLMLTVILGYYTIGILLASI